MLLACAVLVSLSNPYAAPTQASSCWEQVGVLRDEEFGRALLGVDVDGDGFGDLLVGAPGARTRRGGEGRVRLFRGSAQGLASAPAWTLEGGVAGAHLGAVLSRAGDVNGDGFEDILVGAPEEARGVALFPPGPHLASFRPTTHEGAAYLFLGSATGLAPAPARAWRGLDSHERLGWTLDGDFDANGDGFDDVLIGAPGFGGGLGRVQLFLGSSGALATTPAWERIGPQVACGFGEVLGATRDIDKDGFGDFVLSLPRLLGGGTSELFLGSATGPRTSPDAVFARSMEAVATLNLNHFRDIETFYVSPTAPDRLEWFQVQGNSHGHIPVIGAVRAVAFDHLDGDRYEEVVLGVPEATSVAPFGRVWIYTSVSGLSPLDPTTPFPVYDGRQAGAEWGAALATCDVDGDGASELFVGAPRFDVELGDEGAVTMIPSQKPRLSYALVQTLENMLGPGAAGDYDGDGFDDLVVATKGGSSVPGRAELRYGSPAGLPTNGIELPPPTGSGFPTSFGTNFVPGDFNGDGYDDVVVTFFTGGGYRNPVFEGEQRLFVGGPQGLLLAQIVSTEEGFGRRAGDVNGDGKDDLLVTRRARLDLYLGTAGGLSSLPIQSFTAAEEVVAGELDGDGYGDILVGREFGRRFEQLRGSPAGLIHVGEFTFPEATFIPLLLDVDADGRDELVHFHKAYMIGRPDQPRYRVSRLTPAGLEPCPQHWEDPIPDSEETVPVLSSINLWAAFDADLDGRTDLLLSGFRLLRGLPGGGFDRAPLWSGGRQGMIPAYNPAQGPSPIQGDFDGDGKVEVFAHESFDFQLRLLEASSL
jgi:hypothetical protein